MLEGHNMSARFTEAMSHCGLIAILRGVHPEEVSEIGETLYRQGFRIIEVPLNSPNSLQSIQNLRTSLPLNCIVGAGTVSMIKQVEDIRRAGGELIVMPHCDRQIIGSAIAAGLMVIPGVATPSEAFAAISSGATILKIFPANYVGLEGLKALRTVLPADIGLMPVGGITPKDIPAFVTSGANGFGLGSALYKPGMKADDVMHKGMEFVASWREAQKTWRQ
jgi:2-dehydro-3-deoxyphosphogalactonate aldolase